jgi:hypothetical protein
MKKDIKKDIKKHREREDIIDKHQLEYHTNLGRELGYPECCIKQFCEEVKLGLACGYNREKKYRLPGLDIFKLKYVPCDKCVEKMLDDMGIDY